MADTVNFTEARVRQLIAQPVPRGARVEYADEKVSALRLRVGAGGVGSWCVLKRIPGGPMRRLALGKAGELTVEEARKRAQRAVAALLEGRDLAAEKRARREAAASAAAEQAARERATLGALCMAYCDHLQAAGKVSHADTRRTLRRVLEGLPLWTRPAVEVTGQDVAQLLRGIVARGQKRQAAKVRSYLRAAYRLADGSQLDPNAPESISAMGITSNPLAFVMTIKGANRARERVLHVPELRAYWARISAIEGDAGAMLRAHLLLGGQRVQQLMRAQLGDWDRDGQRLTLLDPKGRRNEARKHRVPVIPAAAEALEAMSLGLGPYLFTCDGGATPADHMTLQHRVRRVADAMVEAGESAETFTPGDLRRSVETALAEMGVAAEVRAHLQSHGLSGVQQRHYQKHDFRSEVREALERLHRLLTGQDATVVELRRREGSGR